MHSICAECTVRHLKQQKRCYTYTYILLPLLGIYSYFYTKRLVLGHSKSEIAGTEAKKMPVEL